MSRWSIVGAWVVVTLLATTVTWQIVSAADARVSDRPVAPIQVEAPLLSAAETTTTTGSGSTASIGSSSTTETDGIGSSTTSPSAGGSTTSTTTGATSPPTSTSSTTTAVAWSVKTIETGGGVVVVSYRPGEVVLSSAVPAAGYATEIKKSGPPEVEVEFESVSAKYEVKAKWSNGQLSVETDADID